MKNILVVLLFMSLILGLFGCSTTQAPSTPSVTKYTSFLGVTLGMAKSDVESVLGSGTYYFTQEGGLIYYRYSGDKTVGYLDNKVYNIMAWGTGFSIENITVGSSYTFVISKLGVPSLTNSSDIANFCDWKDRNITIWFYKSTDLAYAIGIQSL